MASDKQMSAFLKHLKLDSSTQSGDMHRRAEELKTAPLLTPAVQQAAASTYKDIQPLFEQYALLAGRIALTRDVLPLRDDSSEGGVQLDGHDISSEVPARLDTSIPILLNTNTPWSAFICGSQGSGKSHTLSCMLENCLLQDGEIMTSKNPLSVMLFNYDKHSSGRPCEAAHLASEVKTRVIVSPSNFWAMQALYNGLNIEGQNAKGQNAKAKKVEIVPLLIEPKRLTSEQVKRLMAFTNDKGEASPIYLQIIEKVLREMALDPKSVQGFNWDTFCSEMQAQKLDIAQQKHFDMRKALLESFIRKGIKGKTGGTQILDHVPNGVDIFDVKSGQLVIVDLTDPMLDASAACSLFDICMSGYVRGKKKHGRVIALDEAHKFLGDNSGATLFTESLVRVIREQRHLGTRVILATQEPTISTELLDLCTMSIVHRFTSPAWMQILRAHLAGAFSVGGGADSQANALFEDIVNLEVGQSLLFSPSAMIDVKNEEIKPLRKRYIKMKTRTRITNDGGRSVMGT